MNLVSTTTRYGMDGPEFESRHGERIVCTSISFSPALRSARPPTQWVSEYITGAKRPSVAEVKNEWSYFSAPPPHVCFHDVVRDTFALLLPFFQQQPNIINSFHKA